MRFLCTLCSCRCPLGLGNFSLPIFHVYFRLFGRTSGWHKIEHSKVHTIGAPCWLDKESKCTVQIFPMELCCFSCNYANTFFVVFKSYYLLHPKRNLCWTDLLILKVPSNFPSFLKMVKQLYLIATALAASISCSEDEFSCRAHETQASMKIIWVSQHTSISFFVAGFQ